MALTRYLPMAIAAAFMLDAGAAVHAQRFAHGREQDSAREAMLDRKAMPFSVLKRRVEQEMTGASYVGMAPPPRGGVVRMQFLRDDGQVIWVDVDSKTGDIIARTR